MFIYYRNKISNKQALPIVITFHDPEFAMIKETKWFGQLISSKAKWTTFMGESNIKDRLTIITQNKQYT